MLHRPELPSSAGVLAPRAGRFDTSSTHCQTRRGRTRTMSSFKLTPSMLAKLERDAESKSVLALAEHLRAHHETRIDGLPDMLLLAMVTMSMRLAKEFGLTRHEDRAGFLALQMEIAPAFFRHASVHSILEDPSIAPDRRLERLILGVSDADWQEASQIQDDWFDLAREIE